MKYGDRLRIVIDTSADHGDDDSDETIAANRLAQSAGKANVARHHFSKLQHNKVFIAKRKSGKDWKPFAVLTGSTNFSLSGLYIQANNTLVFDDEEVAGWYAEAFAAGFPEPDGFRQAGISTKWRTMKRDATTYSICFSPHADPSLSMQRVADAVQAGGIVGALCNRLSRCPRPVPSTRRSTPSTPRSSSSWGSPTSPAKPRAIRRRW